MKNQFFKIVVLLFSLSILVSCTNTKNVNLSIDPGPGDNSKASQHFEISVNGIKSYAYQNFKRNSGEKYLERVPMKSVSWTSFVSPDEVEVVVTFLQKQSLDSVVVRPLSLNIKATIDSNKVTFNMPAGRKVTVEEEGRLEHVCFLFGHMEEPKPEGIADSNIITFEAGVHYLDNDIQLVGSNQAVYLKPGAFIHGRIHGLDVQDAQVVGRGTICASHVTRSDLKFGEGYAEKRASRLLNLAGTNLRVQGPVIVDAPFWSTRIEGQDSSKPNFVSHTAVLGWYVNSDGFQDMKHTRATDLFTCVNDDSFILNNTGDCIVERSVVWGQLAGAPLRLGWNGIEDLDTIIYRNIDVLHFFGKAGIISLKHGGPSHVKNIFIENIRVEEQVHRLIDIEIKKHIWSPKGTGFGHVSNLQIKNVTVLKPLLNQLPNHISGAKEGHIIENILLENITIAGKPIQKLEDIPVITNEFTRDIKVISPM